MLPGNLTAGTNLYVGEAGNPSQKWLTQCRQTTETLSHESGMTFHIPMIGKTVNNLNGTDPSGQEALMTADKKLVGALPGFKRVSLVVALVLLPLKMSTQHLVSLMLNVMYWT